MRRYFIQKKQKTWETSQLSHSPFVLGGPPGLPGFPGFPDGVPGPEGVFPSLSGTPMAIKYSK